MSWNDCPCGPTAASNRTFSCNTNAATITLYCSFQLPAALDSVVAIEAVVDLESAAPALPDWWRFDPSGCRAGNLAASADFRQELSCADPWSRQTSGGDAVIAGYFPGQPRGGANQARIKATAAVASDSGGTLDAVSLYYAVKINIHSGNTTGCTGCTQPACLVLNSLLVGRIPGAPGGDLLLQVPGPSNANWATWQGDGPADCTAVPVKSRTWGQLKSLYR